MIQKGSIQMKKYLSLLLSLCLALSLTACGAKKEPAKAEEPAPETQNPAAEQIGRASCRERV